MKETKIKIESSLIYNESPEKAEELLRLTLAMLGEYELSPNPVNYSLCYEYASKRNQELVNKLEKVFASPGGLTPETADELYRHYVWDDDQRSIEKMRADMSGIVEETLARVGQAQSKASHSAQVLQGHSEQLADVSSAENVQRILSEVIEETRESARNGQVMKKMLEDTQGEVEALKTELARTRQEATTDPLTGLKNRRAFERAMNALMDQMGSEELTDLSLLMVDIDHFKRVNDAYGHLVGDKVIISIASHLAANVKGKDVVSRFGGEEFAILLPGTNVMGGVKLGEILRRGIERIRIKKMDTDESLGKVTISIGVTAMKMGDDITSLIDRADIALYASKTHGRNKVSSEI
jgi:diguanylate cyclase